MRYGVRQLVCCTHTYTSKQKIAKKAIIYHSLKHQQQILLFFLSLTKKKGNGKYYESDLSQKIS